MDNWSAVCIASLLLLQCAVQEANSELFTALVDLEKLLHTEREVIRLLEQYLEAEERKLDKVRKLREEYDRMHRAASEDIQTYLSNPVNAYLMVKRLTTDWKEAENLMLGGSGKAAVQNITTTRNDIRFPDEEDLMGAAMALLRLQDTYKLDTSSLARGQLQGAKHSPELSAGDCFELGRQSYNNGDHYHTVLWMQEALDRVYDETTRTADPGEILEYLAFSTYMQGNVRHALKLTNDLLEVAPDHPRAKGNKVYYEEQIQKTEQRKRGDDGDVPVERSISYPSHNSDTLDLPERETYEQLCRREKTMSPMVEKDLKCRYVTNNSPYLLLQPIKEEEAFLRPRIVVYHDVLSDKEISVIKRLAQPKLKRATVQNKAGELEFASYRISKSAWLRNDDHPVVRRLTQRIEDLTGLTLSTAEELQVVNYGIGGHYEPHYDFARRDEKNAFVSLGTGNRIATWLNYMSDVEAGGATVFPQIGVAVWPKKGSAAFWYNLYKSGEGDMLTRHAACPVLVGSKWVSNKWMHERGQEFRRRCGLRINE